MTLIDTFDLERRHKKNMVVTIKKKISSQIFNVKSQIKYEARIFKGNAVN